jgi:hypothetical protein
LTEEEFRTVIDPIPRKVEQNIFLPPGFVALDEQAIAAISRPAIPPTPGVYFLLCRGRVVYVGQTRSLAARISAHQWRSGSFDSIAFIECDAALLGAIETAYIQRLRPEQNKRISFVGVGAAATV